MSAIKPIQPIQPIQTKYKGYLFRSRLEARWAVFFDALNISWQYEKEGYQLPSGWYLPDFWIPQPDITEWPGSGYWIEVKPLLPTNSEKQLAAELSDQTKHRSFIVSGDPGEFECEFRSCGGEMWWSYESDGFGKAFWLVHSLTHNAASQEMIARGIEAARSARFEHGSNGYAP